MDRFLYFILPVCLLGVAGMFQSVRIKEQDRIIADLEKQVTARYVAFETAEYTHAVTTLKQLAKDWRRRADVLQGDKLMMQNLCIEQLESTIRYIE